MLELINAHEKALDILLFWEREHEALSFVLLEHDSQLLSVVHHILDLVNANRFLNCFVILDQNSAFLLVDENLPSLLKE